MFKVHVYVLCAACHDSRAQALLRATPPAGDWGLRRVTEGLLDTGAHAFAGPRFAHLYRRWFRHGDATFEAVSSAATAEALTTGTGRKECLILPHTYRHLAPVVDRVDSTLERAGDPILALDVHSMQIVTLSDDEAYRLVQSANGYRLP